MDKININAVDATQSREGAVEALLGVDINGEVRRANLTVLDTYSKSEIDSKDDAIKQYTDLQISALIGGATPENLDTIAKLAAALQDDDDVINAINNELSTKYSPDNKPTAEDLDVLPRINPVAEGSMSAGHFKASNGAVLYDQPDGTVWLTNKPLEDNTRRGIGLDDSGPKFWNGTFADKIWHDGNVPDFAKRWPTPLEINAAQSGGFKTTGGMGEMTTANFVEWLKSVGAITSNQWSCKMTWSYGSNHYISDSGLGKIQLAGAVITTWGNDSSYTIEVITGPATNLSGAPINSRYIYQNHGDAYTPTWVRSYDSANKPTKDDVGLSRFSNAPIGNFGSIHISGQSGGYTGITFDNDRAFMIGNDGVSGLFTHAGGDIWYFLKDTLVAGKVPWARIPDKPETATRWPSAAEAGALPSSGGRLTGPLSSYSGITGLGLGVENTAGDGVGLSLYTGATPAGRLPDYGISFAVTSKYGTYGAVSGDWATYFAMQGANTRGWIFKSANNNVASISGTGVLTCENANMVAVGGAWGHNFTGAINLRDTSNSSAYNLIGITGGARIQALGGAGGAFRFLPNSGSNNWSIIDNTGIQTSGTFSGNGSLITNLKWENIVNKPNVANDWINLFNGGITGRVNKVNIPPQMLNHLKAGKMVEVRAFLNQQGSAGSNRKTMHTIVDGADGWVSYVNDRVSHDMTWYGVATLYVLNASTQHGGDANSFKSQYSNITRIDIRLL